MNDFALMWQQSIDSDPYWQFEELIEDEPEVAEYLWHLQRVESLIAKRTLGELKREDDGKSS